MILRVNLFAVLDKSGGKSPYTEWNSVLLGQLIKANQDIFKGIAYPHRPKSIFDAYLIFESDDQERIKSLYHVFDKIVKNNGYRAKDNVKILERWDSHKYRLENVLEDCYFF